MASRSACVFLAAALLLTSVSAGAAGAQTDDSTVSETPHSIGQPPRMRFAVGIQGGYAYDLDSSVGRVFANLTPAGIFPSFGVHLMSLEGGVSYRNDQWSGDIGYYIRIPYIRTGVEWDFRESGLSYVISLQFAGRRGGLFHHGEELRFDYWGRNKELLAGIVLNSPFWKYRRNRPIEKTKKIGKGDIPDAADDFTESGLPGDLEQSVRDIEHAVEWLDRLLTPRFILDDIEERARIYRDHIRIEGHSFVNEDERYHSQLRRAFALAIGDDVAGDQIAEEAERIIYDEIVTPYNSHFAEGKKPETPDGYSETAIELFDSFLASHSRFAVQEADAAERQKALAYEVFRRTVAAIHRTAKMSGERWKTGMWSKAGRLAWLPLNYGLRPEQYDTQAEFDAITEKLTGHDYTRHNTVEYLINEQFHYALKRMILDTRDYHVLVIHDFQGQRNNGETDAKGWEIAADGYMRAMIDAVKAIDAGERERLPQFMVFIDENYYQGNGSRPIMTFMEEIYTSATVDLKDTDIKQHIEETHRELLETIQASPTFQGMSEKELARVFKVHVSVTNVWDPAFALDIDIRDHRKFAFRDVFEEDPAGGEGVLTGTGVGDHYHPPSWEDRALLIRGPALVELKRSVKKLCLSQGFKKDEVPMALRDRPFPADYEDKLQKLWDRGWRENIMIVFNDTGYGEKKATVQRATMYNLAPKKSVLMSLDSLWLSDYWAAMYIAAALRGAHVYAIAPSPTNAPSSAKPTMYLMQQTLELLVAARKYLQEDLDKIGGKIHVGLYNNAFGSGDRVARASAFLMGLEKTPFIIEDFPVAPEVIDVYREYAETWRIYSEESVTDSVSADGGEDEVRPFLHMKTQFFATDVALDILKDEEWESICRKMAEVRTKQLLKDETVGLAPLAIVEFDSISGIDPMEARFKKYLAENRPDERENAILAFTIGSMNQDRRGMLSDGEVLAVCGGYTALIGVMDLFGLATMATWVDSKEDLVELFPEPGMRTRAKRLTRRLQDLF